MLPHRYKFFVIGSCNAPRTLKGIDKDFSFTLKKRGQKYEIQGLPAGSKTRLTELTMQLQSIS